jgi:hypothetical protein
MTLKVMEVVGVVRSSKRSTASQVLWCWNGLGEENDRRVRRLDPETDLKTFRNQERIMGRSLSGGKESLLPPFSGASGVCHRRTYNQISHWVPPEGPSAQRAAAVWPCQKRVKPDDQLLLRFRFMYRGHRAAVSPVRVNHRAAWAAVLFLFSYAWRYRPSSRPAWANASIAALKSESTIPANSHKAVFAYNSQILGLMQANFLMFS